jgi:adenine deaminase
VIQSSSTLNTVDAVVAADIVVDAVAAVVVAGDMADADTVVETADAVVAAARIDRHCHEPVTALSPFPKEIRSCSLLN